ncbi:NAD(P)-binding protein [Wolfiporia cocos MD-104 SS10]|uniref:NAD(P)-binding protein n=1 Tax=Wolfiporia cocos (strain MD-104) TaxID=742152 RepID=A0A2H3JPH1_WOLCO|nr:NAD(P)-binding protein [Wolfiporia cocos MD-104 SS10]
MEQFTDPSPSEIPRVAIVTGAAQGIGRDIAIRLADDGLDVAVNDIPTKGEQLQELVAEIRLKNRRAMAVLADVSSEDEVIAMIARVVDELGGVDMVANVGVLLVKPLLDTSVDEWERTISINVRGTMLCYKYAAKQMIKQGRGGRIIGNAMFSAYSTSKFGIRGLTQSHEFAPYNITVNAYAPGIINTAMGNCPEVISSLVSYLAKPEAHFITGQTIMVNGGFLME